MPKAPIKERIILIEKTRKDGFLHVMDWNLVETDLGPMYESAGSSPSGFSDTNAGTQFGAVDIKDVAATAVQVIEPDSFFAGNMGYPGGQSFYDYNVS